MRVCMYSSLLNCMRARHSSCSFCSASSGKSGGGARHSMRARKLGVGGSKELMLGRSAEVSEVDRERQAGHSK